MPLPGGAITLLNKKNSCKKPSPSKHLDSHSPNRRMSQQVSPVSHHYQGSSPTHRKQADGAKFFPPISDEKNSDNSRERFTAGYEVSRSPSPSNANKSPRDRRPSNDGTSLGNNSLLNPDTVKMSRERRPSTPMLSSDWKAAGDAQAQGQGGSGRERSKSPSSRKLF